MSFVSHIKCDQCGEQGEFQRHALNANAVPSGWFHVQVGSSITGGIHICSWKCLNQYSSDGLTGQHIREQKEQTA